jgi:RimJ/RimL family protein N-acetyltransferase
VSDNKNAFGQPIGESVLNWTARPAPSRAPMEGRYCRLEPLQAEAHAAALYDAYGEFPNESNWTYLPYGPFASVSEYADWIGEIESVDDPIPFAIRARADDRPVGVAAYLRVNPPQGSIEVGHLCYSPTLQRTAAATEAMYLMMRHAFAEIGYRRYEWKCDSRNAASRAAAQRLGFRYEGIFRQAMVIKGRNRDTAWFSILDTEWPEIRVALERWLEPSNFDGAGRQQKRLQALMARSRSPAR